MGRRPLGDLNPNHYNLALDVGGPAQISSTEPIVYRVHYACSA
jgi:hypothetical protein